MRDEVTRERAVRAALENLRRESRYISGVCHSAVQERHVFDGVALTHALASLDAVARARALHVPYSAAYGSAECEHCDHPYPCPTIRALAGEADR